MAKHQFKITIEHVLDSEDYPDEEATLVFRAENHDDIVELASRLGCRDDKELSLLVGLKLFGDAMLDDRENPLYRDILPYFGQFMKRLKAKREGSAPGDHRRD